MFLQKYKIQGWGVSKMGRGSQKVWASSFKKINPGGEMYSMVTTVNNTVLYIWKLLRSFPPSFIEI